MKLLAGFAIIFALIFIIIGIAIVGFMIFAQWKLFVKCHRKGWECIVPYYNTYIYCKMSGTKIMWGIILIVAPFVLSVVSNVFTGIAEFIQNDAISGIMSFIVVILSLASAGVTLVAGFIINSNLAKRFEKSTGYAVGLTLLPIVFIPLLAFGKDEYHEAPVEN